MTQLIVSFEIEGRHFWPCAPIEYSDFRNSHRHYFKFICWYDIDKTGDSARRDKELFELKRELKGYLNDEFMSSDGVADFMHMSCEGIADWLKSQDRRLSKVFCGEEWFLGSLV